MSLMFRKRGKLIQSGRATLTALIAWSLFWIGSWIWLDNRLALIPDLTGSSSVAAFAAELGYDQYSALLNPAGLAGGAAFLVAGNGDADDSFEPPLDLGRQGVLSEKLRAVKAKGLWSDRRLAIAYKDFGHLKVAPTGIAALGVARREGSSYLAVRLSPPIIAGGGLIAFSTGWREAHFYFSGNAA